jgi:hypothetical protein
MRVLVTKRKIILIGLLLFGSYVFGVVSVKQNYFPFGYQISSWVDLVRGIIFPDGKTPQAQQANNVSTTQSIQSLLFDFDITWAPSGEEESYGAIIPLNRETLVHVTQNGSFVIKNLSSQQNAVKTFPNLTLNSSEFQLFTLRNKITSAYDAFGVKDATIIETEAGASAIVVAANYFDVEKECVDLRLFLLKLSELTEGWRTLFQSKPCIRELEGMPSWGGGLTNLGEYSVLLTIGDVLHDGVNYENLIANNEANNGKIYEINLDSGEAELYSVGHRNPQGITKTKQGKIFAVEHGPKGGDELNIIEKGKNYGWPFVTYGVDYGTTGWPLNNNNGSHDGYAVPLMSWTPAIAPSDIAEVSNLDGDLLWGGDILISGLRSQAIFRLKLNEQAVTLIEEIKLDRRVRKLKSFENRIFLKDQITGEIGYFDIPSKNL